MLKSKTVLPFLHILLFLWLCESMILLEYLHHLLPPTVSKMIGIFEKPGQQITAAMMDIMYVLKTKS